MKRFLVVFAGLGVLLISCASAPADVAEDAVPSPEVSAVQNDEGTVAAKSGEDPISGFAVFDPKHPPVEIYSATIEDIRRFVRELDDLIMAKDYDKWLKLLSPGYAELINTPEFLNAVSQQPRLRSQNIVLKNSRDYFLSVVVMSRAGLEADDIEFITMTRVMVFTEPRQDQKIRIYTLDRTPGGWEIVE
jgi:hypothetical protein